MGQDAAVCGVSTIERLLRDHPGASFIFYEADDFIPRDRFAVGVPCDGPLPLTAGYGGGKAWGYAGTIDTALCIALSRRDAVLDDRRVA